MKKFITILTIVAAAILMVSCGAATKTYTNDPYEARGEGFANNKDRAWDIAYMNACEKVMSKFKSEFVIENQMKYKQTQTGYRGTDNSVTTIQIRSTSDGALYDIVVTKEKPVSWWRCRPYRYGYELAVKVNPSNIKAYGE